MIYIPFGDHCAASILLKEIDKRKLSFPYDWCVHKEQMYETNLYTLIETTINLFYKDSKIVAKNFLGNFYENNNINSENNIWFAHDYHESYDIILNKYTRRFERLKNVIKNEECCFISTIRLHALNINIIRSFDKLLKNINKNNKIMIISGKNQCEDFKNTNIHFEYIDYKFSNNFEYDSTYREQIKNFFTEKIK